MEFMPHIDNETEDADGMEVFGSQGDPSKPGRARRKRVKSSSRRSSILKKSPGRVALEDIDPNNEEGEERSVGGKKVRRSAGRRVSFADKLQIKEFHKFNNWNEIQENDPADNPDTMLSLFGRAHMEKPANDVFNLDPKWVEPKDKGQPMSIFQSQGEGSDDGEDRLDTTCIFQDEDMDFTGCIPVAIEIGSASENPDQVVTNSTFVDQHQPATDTCLSGNADAAEKENRLGPNAQVEQSLNKTTYNGSMMEQTECATTNIEVFCKENRLGPNAQVERSLNKTTYNGSMMEQTECVTTNIEVFCKENRLGPNAQVEQSLNKTTYNGSMMEQTECATTNIEVFCKENRLGPNAQVEHSLNKTTYNGSMMEQTECVATNIEVFYKQNPFGPNYQVKHSLDKSAHPDCPVSSRETTFNGSMDQTECVATNIEVFCKDNPFGPNNQVKHSLNKSAHPDCPVSSMETVSNRSMMEQTEFAPTDIEIPNKGNLSRDVDEKCTEQRRNALNQVPHSDLSTSRGSLPARDTGKAEYLHDSENVHTMTPIVMRAELKPVLIEFKSGYSNEKSMLTHASSPNEKVKLEGKYFPKTTAADIASKHEANKRELIKKASEILKNKKPRLDEPNIDDQSEPRKKERHDNDKKNSALELEWYNMMLKKSENFYKHSPEQKPAGSVYASVLQSSKWFDRTFSDDAGMNEGEQDDTCDEMRGLKTANNEQMEISGKEPKVDNQFEKTFTANADVSQGFQEDDFTKSRNQYIPENEQTELAANFPKKPQCNDASEKAFSLNGAISNQCKDDHFGKGTNVLDAENIQICPAVNSSSEPQHKYALEKTFSVNTDMSQKIKDDGFDESKNQHSQGNKQTVPAANCASESQWNSAAEKTFSVNTTTNQRFQDDAFDKSTYKCHDENELASNPTSEPLCNDTFDKTFTVADMNRRYKENGFDNAQYQHTDIASIAAGDLKNKTLEFDPAAQLHATFVIDKTKDGETEENTVDFALFPEVPKDNLVDTVDSDIVEDTKRRAVLDELTATNDKDQDTHRNLEAFHNTGRALNETLEIHKDSMTARPSDTFCLPKSNQSAFVSCNRTMNATRAANDEETVANAPPSDKTFVKPNLPKSVADIAEQKLEREIAEPATGTDELLNDFKKRSRDRLSWISREQMIVSSTPTSQNPPFNFETEPLPIDVTSPPLDLSITKIENVTKVDVQAAEMIPQDAEKEQSTVCEDLGTMLENVEMPEECTIMNSDEETQTLENYPEYQQYISNVRKEKAEMEMELKELSLVLAEKDRQLDDLNSLKNEVMEMKNSINSRVEESEKMEKLIREKQTELAEIEGSKACLQKENENMQQRKSYAEFKLSGLKEEKENAGKKAEVDQKKHQKREEQLKKLLKKTSSLLGWLVTLKNDKAVFRLWDKRFFELTVDFEEIDDETFQKDTIVKCNKKIKSIKFERTDQEPYDEIQAMVFTQLLDAFKPSELLERYKTTKDLNKLLDEVSMTITKYRELYEDIQAVEFLSMVNIDNPECLVTTFVSPSDVLFTKFELRCEISYEIPSPKLKLSLRHVILKDRTEIFGTILERIEPGLKYFSRAAKAMNHFILHTSRCLLGMSHALTEGELALLEGVVDSEQR